MKKLTSLVLSIAFISALHGQQAQQPSSDEIFQKIKKLNVLGNVLYLAAHPDDENTRFIAYCANEKLFNTSYLSLTRGDGGQNLIGTEIGEALGILRTQELLAARRIDGGHQYFSRAIDFGYSKTSKETLEIWEKEKILSDVVWVIRKTHPDIIVCRFPPDKRAGHGHHTASAELGVEAFSKAADPDVFPEQLDEVKPWQATRIVTNTGRWWNDQISADDEGVVAEDIGQYNELLGISYNELAALSRSQHKSQGFGTTGTRGEQLEYFEHLQGKEARQSLFDDINSSWDRVEDSKTVQKIVQQLIETYDLEKPENSIDLLIKLRKEIKQLNNAFWKTKKLEEIDEIIKDCLGLYAEASIDKSFATPGSKIEFNLEVVNRSTEKITLTQICEQKENNQWKLAKTMGDNEKVEKSFQLVLGTNYSYSQPYWLVNPSKHGLYTVEDRKYIGSPENPASLEFNLDVEVQGEHISYSIPLVHKWNDPVKGALYEPFSILPPVAVVFEEESYIFRANQYKTIEVTVTANQDDFTGELRLEAPQGWQIETPNWDINLKLKGEQLKIKTLVTANNSAQKGDLIATVMHNKQAYQEAVKTIQYDHIPTQRYLSPAKTHLVFLDLKIKGNKIGYLPGAGDKVPESLRNMGYSVDVLEETSITKERLTNYDCIMLGIRALNTIERIDFMMPILLQYVENGGTLVVQYNTAHRLKTDKIGPYPIQLSRDRVTNEYAKVSFLNQEHSLLHVPNKISQQDFEGWVQERGLYFPDQWDLQYEALLSWSDEGEAAKKGALLAATYGKGHFVYTGISFFRQLPAGVPGAYRLLANIVSWGND